MNYCCSKLKLHLEQTCPDHDDPWDCSDYTLVNVNGIIGIPVRDGGSSFIQIDFCPWCGRSIDAPNDKVKVVINDTIGGFGISDWAIKELYLQGSRWIGVNPYGDPNNPQHSHHYNRRILTTVTHRDEQGVRIELCSNYKWENYEGIFRSTPRTCELLVKLIEEHGSRVNGDHAELKIVEVPANVSWDVCENETGVEWVAERHRVWGND